MKLASYRVEGRDSFGIVDDEMVIDLPRCWPEGPRTLLELIAGGDEAIHRAANRATLAQPAPLESVKLLAPIPTPPKLIGIAVNYLEHHREFDRGHDLPDDARLRTTPRPFLMPHTCVIGPGATIPWPVFSEKIDHEIELAVVIGHPCRNVMPDDALDYVFGYTIANDISARTVTHADGRMERPKDDFFDWLHGKLADGFCPLGPWIVTADEIGDPQRLGMSLAVNGETRQDDSTASMIFPVAELVSFCSHIMTLVPGDIIATGTPSGVAKATGKWLRGGDEIRCRIEGIGELTNTLGQPPAEFFRPCRMDV
jgi:2-keto-4-pentenoate hydratase/2-oxohepta-3-ene-1,7-dioic acid hydratase in catechol pathway